ncbi:MAG: hypothetical protein ACYTFT_08080, partial [Planctomycetota bacterium]
MTSKPKRSGTMTSAPALLAALLLLAPGAAEFARGQDTPEQTAPDPAAAPVAVVLSVTGEVTLVRAGKERPLSSFDLLQPSDRLKPAANASATVMDPAGRTITLTEDTTIAAAIKPSETVSPSFTALVATVSRLKDSDQISDTGAVRTRGEFVGEEGVPFPIEPRHRRLDPRPTFRWKEPAANLRYRIAIQRDQGEDEEQLVGHLTAIATGGTWTVPGDKALPAGLYAYTIEALAETNTKDGGESGKPETEPQADAIERRSRKVLFYVVPADEAREIEEKRKAFEAT